MKFSGKCVSIDRIVVSDPSYDENVWCRYENNDIKGKDWNVVGFINDVSENYEGISITGKEFTIALNSPSPFAKLTLKEDGSFAYWERVKLNKFTVGMDTACVGFGVNENADEIKARRDDYHPDNCLKTLTDGEFGEVFEGVYNGEVQFVVISGYLDEDAGYSKQDILDYIGSALNVEFLRVLEKDNIHTSINKKITQAKTGKTNAELNDKDNVKVDARFREDR